MVVGEGKRSAQTADKSRRPRWGPRSRDREKITEDGWQLAKTRYRIGPVLGVTGGPELTSSV